MKKLYLLIVALIAVLFTSNVALAEGSTEGSTVSGTVTFGDYPLPYAPIYVVNHPEYSAITSSDGSFAINGVEEGTYKFDVYHPNNNSILLYTTADYVLSAENTVADIKVKKESKTELVEKDCQSLLKFDDWTTNNVYGYISGTTLPNDFYAFNRTSISGNCTIYLKTGGANGDSDKVLYGKYDTDIIIFKIDKENTTTISYSAKYDSSYASGSAIKFYKVTKKDKNGDFTQSNTSVELIDTKSYTSYTDFAEDTYTTGSEFEGEEYIGISLYYCYLDNLRSYSEGEEEISYVNIPGKVTLENAPLANETVTLTLDENTAYTATSDEYGKFTFYAVESNLNRFEFDNAAGDYTAATATQTINDEQVYNLVYNTTDVLVNVYENSSGTNLDDITVLLVKDGDIDNPAYETSTVNSSGTYYRQFKFSNVIGNASSYKIYAQKQNYYMVEDNTANAKGVDGVTVANTTTQSVYISNATVKTSEGLQTIDGKHYYITVTFSIGANSTLSLIDDYNITLNRTGDYKEKEGVKTTATVESVPMTATVSDGVITLTRLYQEDDWFAELLKGEYTLTIPANTIKIDEALYPYEISEEYGVETGIESVTATDADLLDVYTTSGMMVKRGIDATTLEQLPAGLYIVRSASKAYKFIKK